MHDRAVRRSSFSMVRRFLLFLFLLILAAIAIFFAVSWRTEIAPIEPPARSTFDSALISRGASLAAIGDCIACHTAPEGKAYAGGFPLKTPFGKIYGTNITPDPDTGIGRWPQAAFVRAMREGVDREGRHLYPAFPYDHFTIVSDDDLNAIYAYLMTREPVRQERFENELIFPLNVRNFVAGWKLLFLDRQPFRAEPSQSADWNRGAYLVEGLAHCGACHTPRNALGAERRRQYLSGGQAEGWDAPAINAASRAPVPWTADSLFRYLRHGASETNEVAAGPMAPVVHNLSQAPEQDVRAIATYIASVMGEVSPERLQRSEWAMARARGGVTTDAQAPAAGRASDSNVQIGGVIYGATCATCHGSAERPPGAASADALHLALSTSVALPSPNNLIRIILQGLAPPDGERGPIMPGFSGALTDEQVAALAVYLRATYTDRPAWRNLDREVRSARQSVSRGPEH
jgi:mono/diheme cytochrome c family protein